MYRRRTLYVKYARYKQVLVVAMLVVAKFYCSRSLVLMSDVEEADIQLSKGFVLRLCKNK